MLDCQTFLARRLRLTYPMSAYSRLPYRYLIFYSVHDDLLVIPNVRYTARKWPPLPPAGIIRMMFDDEGSAVPQQPDEEPPDEDEDSMDEA